jgi:hypothetical protein
MGLVEQDHIWLVLDVLKGITLGFMCVLGFQIMKKIAISTIIKKQKTIHQYAAFLVLFPSIFLSTIFFHSVWLISIMKIYLINFINTSKNWIPIMQIHSTLLWLLCDLKFKSTRFERKPICNPYKKRKGNYG